MNNAEKNATVKAIKEEYIKKLADLIEKNPECQFEIDNDVWYMSNKKGKEIATSNEFGYTTEWYGHSSNYGFGISEALIEVLNRNGFKITAGAV